MADLASEKAATVRQLGIRTANQLRDATKHANPEHQDELAALGARLTYCNSPRNTWLGTDIHSTETGELFEGFGRYWQCGSKLCSYCLRLNAKRNRQTLRDAISTQKLHSGEHYRFITLTLPNLGLDIVTTRAIVNRAWSLFRKRLFFVRSVVGGAKAEEFTVTSHGFHYHLHLLVRSKSIHANEARYSWTECVKKAFADFKQEFVAPTSDGMLFVNIKIVHNLSQVSNEVCKYITKANSWWKMPTDALIQIALIPMWHRMFEVFGSFRSIAQPDHKSVMRHLSDERTQNDLFDDDSIPPEARNHWRKLIKIMTLKKYLARLHAEVNETIRRRHEILQLKFPYATITALESG
jgi:hypothetical protein